MENMGLFDFYFVPIYSAKETELSVQNDRAGTVKDGLEA